MLYNVAPDGAAVDAFGFMNHTCSMEHSCRQSAGYDRIFWLRDSRCAG
jgi:hypothetical protein